MTYQEAESFLFHELQSFQEKGRVAFNSTLDNALALSELLDNPIGPTLILIAAILIFDIFLSVFVMGDISAKRWDNLKGRWRAPRLRLRQQFRRGRGRGRGRERGRGRGQANSLGRPPHYADNRNYYDYYNNYYGVNRLGLVENSVPDFAMRAYESIQKFNRLEL